MDKLDKEGELARMMLKMLGDVHIIPKAKYKSVQLFDLISEIIDIEDIHKEDKENEERYNLLINMIDDFMHLLKKQFKEI